MLFLKTFAALKPKCTCVQAGAKHTGQQGLNRERTCIFLVPHHDHTVSSYLTKEIPEMNWEKKHDSNF